MNNNPVESNSALISLASEVLKKYGITPVNISVIQSGTIKTVWKVKAGNGLLCLKRLKQSLDKALFSVNAQIYIKTCGGNVPAIIADKSGQPIVQHNEQLFVLYEWLEGKDLDLNSAADLGHAVQGLAEFHTFSKGYNPIEDARVSTKLGKWSDQYASMMKKFTAWKAAASEKASLSNHAAYLKYADSIINICDTAIKLLDKSAYDRLAALGSPSIVLCHQDYGKGNALLTAKGVYVLDLDGVTYDLPSRDLRKIIGKLCENKGHWENSTIKNVLEYYTKINPLSNEEKEVLYVDLMFPHWFYGLVKNLYLNNKTVKASEIEKMAKFEQSKVQLLNTLIKRGD